MVTLSTINFISITLFEKEGKKKGKEEGREEEKKEGRSISLQ